MMPALGYVSDDTLNMLYILAESRVWRSLRYHFAGVAFMLSSEKALVSHVSNHEDKLRDGAGGSVKSGEQEINHR